MLLKRVAKPFFFFLPRTSQRQVIHTERLKMHSCKEEKNMCAFKLLLLPTTYHMRTSATCEPINKKFAFEVRLYQEHYTKLYVALVKAYQANHFCVSEIIP